ncbi:unnamed protein product [Sympodiomycopsis kandeliae]
MAQVASDPVAHTRDQGTFRGLFSDDTHTEVFHGIPYAQPPLGDLRFQRTQPVKPYIGRETRDATKVNKFAMQSTEPTYDEYTSEDCLYLQIHRPAGTKQGDDLPVMFWIHGGAWTMGSTATWGSPHSLVQQSATIGKPIIHRAAEYRLGVFGFLGGSEMVSAAANGSAVLNAGFYDQREAMRWVQHNIRSFGGDPTKVTIFGESAGAHSCGIHLLANGGDCEALFSGAILLSGAPATSARYKATDDRMQSAYDQLLERTGCENLEALRRMPSKDLRDASASINWQKFHYGYPAWMPVIDGLFIPDIPSKVYDKGAIADVPIIMGNVLDEGTIFAEWAADVTDEQELISGILVYQGKETANLAPQMLKLYRDDADLSPFRPEYFGKSADEHYFGPTSSFRRAAAIFGDYTFHAPMRSMLRATKQMARRSPTWGYLFAQPSSWSYADDKAWNGVAHGSEIPFVYNNPGKANSSPSTSEAKYCSAQGIQEVASFMSRAWINFAQHQDPNNSDDAIKWPPHSDGGRLMWIQAGHLTTIGDDYRKDQIDFFLQHKDVYRM